MTRRAGLALVVSATVFAPVGCFWSHGTTDVRAGDKRPGVAGVLGLVPSFGAGHRYAGEVRTANVLMVTEAVGMLSLMPRKGSRPVMDFSDGSWTLPEIGLLTVFGSVIYDASRAPSAARRHNQARRRFDGIITPVGGVGSIRF